MVKRWRKQVLSQTIMTSNDCDIVFSQTFNRTENAIYMRRILIGKRMLRNGHDINYICRLLHLTIDQCNALKNWKYFLFKTKMQSIDESLNCDEFSISVGDKKQLLQKYSSGAEPIFVFQKENDYFFV